MGVELDISIRCERGSVIVTVTGETGIFTVPRLREQLFALADAGEPLIVDLEQTTFSDSACIGALVGLSRRASAHGGSLHVVCTQPEVQKLLSVSGLDRQIALSASVDEALAFSP